MMGAFAVCQIVYLAEKCHITPPLSLYLFDSQPEKQAIPNFGYK